MFFVKGASRALSLGGAERGASGRLAGVLWYPLVSVPAEHPLVNLDLLDVKPSSEALALVRITSQATGRPQLTVGRRLDQIHSLCQLERPRLAPRRSRHHPHLSRRHRLNMALEAIRYERGSLRILDQLQLPHVTAYEEVRGVTEAWQAIRAMRVRGAPAIAIVAALALAVELTRQGTAAGADADAAAASVAEKLAFLVTSRPTAVNLADAAGKLRHVVTAKAAEPGADGPSVAAAYVAAAERMLVDDVADNRAIGAHGAAWVVDAARQAGVSGPVRVLTHCNTGCVVPSAARAAA